MKKVFLSIGDITLGYLCEKNEGYMFHASSDSIKEATKNYPIKMKFFTLNKSGINEYPKIPNHFIQYLENVDRIDIVEKAGIVDGDSDFIKLYKVAGLKCQPINFKISQG